VKGFDLATELCRKDSILAFFHVVASSQIPPQYGCKCNINWSNS